MKLTEITTPALDKNEIGNRLQKYNINSVNDNITINSDGTIDLSKGVWISMSSFFEFVEPPKKEKTSTGFSKSIPLAGKRLFFERFDVQFGTTTKDFSIHDCLNLISLKGCPTKVEGLFRLTQCPGVNSLEYAPAWIGGNCVIGGNGPKIKDFGSIKYVGGKLTFIDTSIVNLIKVLDIGGVKEVDCGNKKINEILNKYLKQPVIHKRDMLGFQDEMIEAGFSGYVEVE